MEKLTQYILDEQLCSDNYHFKRENYVYHFEKKTRKGYIELYFGNYRAQDGKIHIPFRKEGEQIIYEKLDEKTLPTENLLNMAYRTMKGLNSIEFILADAGIDYIEDFPLYAEVVEKLKAIKSKSQEFFLGHCDIKLKYGRIVWTNADSANTLYRDFAELVEVKNDLYKKERTWVSEHPYGAM